MGFVIVQAVKVRYARVGYARLGGAELEQLPSPQQSGEQRSQLSSLQLQVGTAGQAEVVVVVVVDEDVVVVDEDPTGAPRSHWSYVEPPAITTASPKQEDVNVELFSVSVKISPKFAPGSEEVFDVHSSCWPFGWMRLLKFDSIRVPFHWYHANEYGSIVRFR